MSGDATFMVLFYTFTHSRVMRTSVLLCNTLIIALLTDGVY